MRGHYTGMRNFAFRGIMGINRVNQDHTLYQADDGRAEVKECVNYTLNSLLRARPRPGQELLHAGARNIWSAKGYFFFTQDGGLYRMNPAGAKFLIDDTADETAVNYVLAGEDVLISTATKKYRIRDDIASYWLGVAPVVDDADTRTYFFPATDNGPMCYHGGRLFFAIGNIVYESLLFNFNAFERSRRLQFNEAVRAMIPVSGGIYFLLETMVVFMAGSTVADFSEKLSLSATPLCTQAIYIPGETVPKFNVGGECAIIVASDGVYLADENGRCHNMTSLRLEELPGTAAYAVLRGRNLIFTLWDGETAGETFDLSIGPNALSTYEGMTLAGPGASYRNNAYIQSATGLTILAGTLDFGQKIATRVQTGPVNYVMSPEKAPRYCQLSGKFVGAFTLTCLSDNGTSLTFQSAEFDGNKAVKVPLSRELKGYYHIYTIENVDGSQIELHGLEVALIPSARVAS